LFVIIQAVTVTVNVTTSRALGGHNLK